MLRKLSIRNFLLIDRVDLDIHQGFTVLTGDTGAGKSILIDALGLALGNRAESGIVRKAEKRCIVEVEMDPPSNGDWFVANDIPNEPVLVLRRHIEPGGRSRAFVNDTPVRLEQIRVLGESLIHIHSQHHNRILNDSRAFVRLLDMSAVGVVKLRNDYTEKYQNWRRTNEKLQLLIEENENPEFDADYLEFQLGELDSAELKIGELQELEAMLQTAENAEEITAIGHQLNISLEEDDGIVAKISDLKLRCSRLAEADEKIKEYVERLNSIVLELKDLARDAGDHAESIENDDQVVEQLRDRVDLINRLLRKHRVTHEEELLKLQENIRNRVALSVDRLSEIDGLKKKLSDLETQVLDSGMKLRHARMQAAPLLESTVTSRLKQLGIKSARFKLTLQPKEISVDGMDRVEPMFSADADRPLTSIHKGASGGEQSRIMLSLIGPICKALEVETLILDEVDVGISGEVAKLVGASMKNMAHDLQTIAISHLPQVVGQAEHHIHVSKSTEDGETESRVATLEEEDRLKVLAQMLSGSTTSEAAFLNAKELLAKE